MLLGTGVDFDVEDVSVNALPSFPREEFQLVEELSEGEFSSLS